MLYFLAKVSHSGLVLLWVTSLTWSDQLHALVEFQRSGAYVTLDGMTSKTKCVVLFGKIGQSELYSFVRGNLEWYGSYTDGFQWPSACEKRYFKLTSKNKYSPFFAKVGHNNLVF